VDASGSGPWGSRSGDRLKDNLTGGPPLAVCHTCAVDPGLRPINTCASATRCTPSKIRRRPAPHEAGVAHPSVKTAAKAVGVRLPPGPPEG